MRAKLDEIKRMAEDVRSKTREAVAVNADADAMTKQHDNVTEQKITDPFGT